MSQASPDQFGPEAAPQQVEPEVVLTEAVSDSALPPDDQVSFDQSTGLGADPAAGTGADAAVAVDPLAAERDQYLDALRRMQADFENYKKRMAKQQADTTERAAEGLVTRLLPVLDTLDLAVMHQTSPELEAIWSQVHDVLGREGLDRIDPDGKAFDPNEHDAVLHEEGEGGPVVAEVMRAGYRWKGRVMRPAMVKVRGS